MNDHRVRITRADVESVAAKLETFVEGLPLGERTAVGLVLTALPRECPASDDVEGSGWVIEGMGALARGIHRIIHGAPGTEACTTTALSISALGGQQHGIGRQSLQ